MDQWRPFTVLNPARVKMELRLLLGRFHILAKFQIRAAATP
jgi:hypothetical protein